MSDVDAVFGQGDDMAYYRGKTYYTASTGPHTFPAAPANIALTDFYGTGPDDPTSEVVVNNTGFAWRTSATGASQFEWLNTLNFGAGNNQMFLCIASFRGGGLYGYISSVEIRPAAGGAWVPLSLAKKDTTVGSFSTKTIVMNIMWHHDISLTGMYDVRVTLNTNVNHAALAWIATSYADATGSHYRTTNKTTGDALLVSPAKGIAIFTSADTVGNGGDVTAGPGKTLVVLASESSAGLTSYFGVQYQITPSTAYYSGDWPTHDFQKDLATSFEVL